MMYAREEKNRARRSRAAASRVARTNGNAGLEDNRDLSGYYSVYRASVARSTTIKQLSQKEGSIQLLRKIKVNEEGEQWLADSQYPKGKKYSWKCSFYIYLPGNESERQIVQCVIYIKTKASDKVVDIWQAQINNTWGRKFAIKTGTGTVLPITVQIHKSKKKANYSIENVSAKKARGKRGLFGTESMTKWGENDPQDIPHEVGHMLGNKDEYGKVWEPREKKWFDYGYANYPGKDARDKSNVMMRGDLPVRQRHFDLIFTKVRESGYLGDDIKLIKYMKGHK